MPRPLFQAPPTHAATSSGDQSVSISATSQLEKQPTNDGNDNIRYWLNKVWIVSSNITLCDHYRFNFSVCKQNRLVPSLAHLFKLRPDETIHDAMRDERQKTTIISGNYYVLNLILKASNVSSVIILLTVKRQLKMYLKINKGNENIQTVKLYSMKKIVSVTQWHVFLIMLKWFKIDKLILIHVIASTAHLKK